MGGVALAGGAGSGEGGVEEGRGGHSMRTTTDRERAAEVARQLVDRAGLIPGGQWTIPARAVAQLLVNLTDALVDQSEAAATLNRRIAYLTAIAAVLALIQTAAAVIQVIPAWR